MPLSDLFNQPATGGPWEGKYKIPWDEPGFSRRMLREHLSQEHDLASRRQTTIDCHVAYIHEGILKGRTSRILDLGCGPGFYARRLAALGHAVHGIDFSPASIEYAEKLRTEDVAGAGQLDYALGDMRSVDYGDGYDLAMMIFGEFCAFPPETAAAILSRMKEAVVDGGQILIEAVTHDVVKQSGQAAPSWYRSERGLFSDRPHVCLIENEWDEADELAISRFHVIEDTGGVAHFRNTLQAYSDDAFRKMPEKAGLVEIEIRPPWGQDSRERADEQLMLCARKPARS